MGAQSVNGLAVKCASGPANGNRNPWSRVDATVNVGNGERGGCKYQRYCRDAGCRQSVWYRGHPRCGFSERPLVLVGVLRAASGGEIDGPG